MSNLALEVVKHFKHFRAIFKTMNFDLIHCCENADRQYMVEIIRDKPPKVGLNGFRNIPIGLKRQSN